MSLSRAFVAALALVAAVLLVLSAEVALAQGAPFGMGARQPPPPAPVADGVTGWIMTKQAEFYRGLSAALRAAKADGSAAWGLMALSFLYGVFHAAGPGHGKAVISSYLLANEATWRRGTVLAFASAAVQGLVAISLVVIASVLIGATATQMGATVRVIEIASYAGILALGLWLIWRKGRALVAAWRGDAGGHVHGPDCAHVPAVDPRDLTADGGLRRAAAAVVAVGLRPCSGAIIVLVFALAQGVLWLGVAATAAMSFGTAMTVAGIAAIAVFAKRLAVRLAATSAGGGALALHALELLGAVLVALFGALLLAGFMASERMLPF